jgi:uncharacterized protein (DUF2236 family)
MSELGLRWSGRCQIAFDVATRLGGSLCRQLPAPLRAFPLKLYLWDARRRTRAGHPIV